MQGVNVGIFCQLLKRSMINVFYVEVFFALSLPRLLLDLTVYMSNMKGVL